jgi:hypothetical protein
MPEQQEDRRIADDRITAPSSEYSLLHPKIVNS